MNPLAVLKNSKSVLSSSNYLSTTELSKPETLRANNQILYEMTISSPSLSTKVFSSPSYFSDENLGIIETVISLDLSERSTFSLSKSIPLGVKSLSHLSRKPFTTYNPAAYASAFFSSLYASKSNRNTFSN